MNEAARITSSLAGLLLLVGCGGSFPSLEAAPAGYEHPTYGYVFEHRAGGGLLPFEWSSSGSERRTRTLPLDLNGDGVAEDGLEIPLFDLHYARGGAAGAAIFVSTFPTSTEAATGDLAAILDRYVTSAARSGRVDYGFPRSVPENMPAAATRMLGSRAREVNGYEAHEVLFEIAEGSVSSGAAITGWRRGHVVLVRAELSFSDRQFDRRDAVSSSLFSPALFVAGFVDDAERFDESHGAFDDLLSRLRFDPEPLPRDVVAALGNCVDSETVIRAVVLPEGRVGAHAALADQSRERCVSATLVAARMAPSDWPRTVAVRVGTTTPGS